MELKERGKTKRKRELEREQERKQEWERQNVTDGREKTNCRIAIQDLQVILTFHH